MFGCFELSEKAKIYKNFIAYNCATILTFAAYDTVASVSSVLDQDQSLGTTSQSIVYFVQFITALVWPQICIEVIGFKFTLALSQLCYLLFFIANTFPSWGTMIPTSILAGFGNALFWTNLGIYFTLLAKRLAHLTGRTFHSAQTFLFGIFGSIFLLNYVLASVWIAGILEVEELPMNTTFDYALSCGMNNCPDTRLPDATSEPSLNSIYNLFATLIGATLIALAIGLLFVDDLKYDDNLVQIERHAITTDHIKELFINEFGSLYEISKCLDIWLLLPIATYLGYELTFLWFEYNRGYVSCLKNVNYIGWANIVFGIVGTVVSGVFGYIGKIFGMKPIIFFMLTVAFFHCLFMIFWVASGTQSYIIFFMAVAFALSNSLATSQVRGVFGIFFPDNNSAFSAAMIFETIGLVMGSVLSVYFCVRVKVYIYMLIIVLSFLTYMLLEIRTSRRNLTVYPYEEQKETDRILP